MEEKLYHEMFQLETAHWWFRAKRRIVSYLIEKYWGTGHRPRILDLGCGTGAMLQFLEGKGEVTGLDCSPEALDYARSRSRARLVQGSLPEDLDKVGRGYDCVLMLDLLEHLPQDATTLEKVRSLLDPQGIALITVPAYQWLYSPRDSYHHHLRRYSYRDLRKLLMDSGYRVLLLSYYNFFLFPAALISRIIDIVSKKEPGPDLSLPPSPVNKILEEIFASERFLLPRLRLPWGLSLIAVVTPE